MHLNTEKLKRFNADLVRAVLKREPWSTKSSLSLETGLSLSTCGNILSHMLDQGEILEDGTAAPEGGRPSVRYRYNHDHTLLALVYVNREKGVVRLYYSVVNTAGESLKEERRQTPSLTSDDLIALADRLAADYERLKIISFGIPGVVRQGRIEECEIDSLSHFDLKGIVERKTGLIVSVENDVNCAALGYGEGAVGKGPESLVYMYYPEEGISGAGIVINGRVLRGESDFAGEISYLPLGIAMGKQGRIQRNHKRFTELLSKTVLSINCLINPGCIVICSQWFTEEFRHDFLKKLEPMAPEKHVPLIFFEPRMHDSYIRGLFREGIRLLDCGFEVINR